MASGKKLLTWRWGGVITVLLIAAFFRFYRIGDHPLGIFFDPAINGLDSLRLMQRGGYVLFFPTNGGRESLFMLLLMPFIELFGSTPFAMRALTASLSLLMVALLFGFLWNLRFTFYVLRPLKKGEVWGGTPLYPPACGAFFAALVLATMPWAISVSRLGQRPVLVPLLAVAVFGLFLKGWFDGRARWFIASGALLGLAVGYTYGAARLLPVILLLAILPEFFLKNPEPQGRRGTESRHWSPATRYPLPDIHHSPFTVHSSQLKNLLLFLAAALIIYAPMAWYFAAHPAQFSARAGSVMVWNFLDTPAAIAAELGRNALRVAGFFCCAGSPNPIFGLPGTPGLSPWLAPFLLIGLVAALANWRSLFHRLVALWWLVGIAPSVIAIEAPHPLRMIAAIPATAMLVALGLYQVQFSMINWLRENGETHPMLPGLRRLTLLLPLLLILLPLPALYRAYFIEWTARQDTQGVYDYGAVAIRDAVLARAAADPATPIYLPHSRANDSTLLYYLGGAFAREAHLAALPAEQAIAISPQKFAADSSWVRLQNGVMTVLPPLTADGQALMQAALVGPQAEAITIPTSGETAALVAPLPADPALYTQGLTRLAEAEFGSMRLTGANTPEVISPGQSRLPVTLFWEATRPMRDEYEVLVRLVDDSRRSWGNGDARPNDWLYPTSFWRPGFDKIAAQHTVEIDPNLPPGRYWLAVSVFDAAAGEPLLLTAGGGDSPDTLYLGPLKVGLPPPQNRPPLAESPLATFGDVARLDGFRLEPARAAPGDVVQLELVWQAESAPPLDYTVFVHLLDAAGQQLAGFDRQPVGGSYPTSIWSAGEQVIDLHGLPLPPELPPGVYRVAVGLYHQPSGQRLPLTLPGNQIESEGQLVLPLAITVK